MDDVFLEDATSAARYRETHREFIVSERGFFRKAAYLLFKQRHLGSFPSLLVASGRVSGARQVGSDGAVAMLDNDDGGTQERIELYYRTTSTSRILMIIIRFMDAAGNDSWVWKPDFMVPALMACVRGGSVQDPIVCEFLANLALGKASDPNETNKNRPLVVQYSLPNDPQETINRHVRRAYSHVTIPHGEIETRQDELTWIVSAVEQVGQGLRRVMGSSEFKASLERIASRRGQHYIAKLYRSSQEESLNGYLQSVVVAPLPVRCMHDHVVQSVCSHILFKLWTNRLGRPKYPPDPNEEGETEAKAIDLVQSDDGEESEEDLGGTANRESDKDCDHPAANDDGDHAESP